LPRQEVPVTTLLLLVLAFFGAAVTLFFAVLRRTTETERVTRGLWGRALARRVGGTWTETSEPRNPLICFPIAGRLAEFSFKRGDDPFTALEIQVDGLSPGALEIRRGSPPAFLRRLLRIDDIDVGDPGFDRDYLVQANPPSVAHRLFSVERKNRLVGRIRNLESLGPPWILLSRDVLIVGVRQVVDDHARLSVLVRCAEPFVEALQELKIPAGIRWGAAGSGVCPICASALESDVVSCGRCRTPHHRECWRYIGRCSVYACSGRTS
jgi:hypothetical protein